MSNPFDDEDGQILEGFLCPICREDLKSFEFLTEHVEKNHAEDEDAIKSVFKEIFNKAKKKIRINFDETVDLAKNIEKDLKVSGDTTRSNVFNYMDYQTVGVDCSHLSYFISIRDPRSERYASETNKLIIRLNKLLTNRPTDLKLRKIHEQKIVPWIDGSLVKLCPSCAKSFHIARRQHHCRLCGSIMCDDCSKFLALADACELASLSSSQEDEDKTEKENEEHSIRSCDHCYHLLDARREMHISRTCKANIVELYNAIQERKKKIIPDMEMYKKIINSLYEGESIFTISDASALRGKIGRVAEEIELISRRILALPYVSGCRENALQKSIHLANVQFIKDRMLTIPQLPVEAEIKKIQEKRRMETEMRIERERRLALEAYEKYGLAETNSITSSDSYASGSAVKTLDNWSAHQVNSTTTSAAAANDPLIEQINIIKGYIKQARAAMRFDEVETLEINLRELQNEFYNRQQKAN